MILFLILLQDGSENCVSRAELANLREEILKLLLIQAERMGEQQFRIQNLEEELSARKKQENVQESSIDAINEKPR